MGLALTTAAFSGCAMGRLGQGPTKSGYALDARGADAQQARRACVAAVFDAYLSTSARAASRDALEREILSGATDYVTRDKVLSTRGEGGRPEVKLRCLVDYQKLGKVLEGRGLVKPEGVVGRPKAAVWITGDPRAERAAEALRGALERRGYEAWRVEASGEAAALARSRDKGAALLVSGRARVEDSRQPALAELHPADAEAALKLVSVPAGEALDDLSARATALDVDPAQARDKALENAGLLAADKMERFLKPRYRERDEMSVLILGLGKLPEVERLLAQLRVSPGVAGAALSSLAGGDTRLRVFTERLSADELAADFVRLPGFSFTVRAVENDFNAVELDTAGEAPL